MILTTALDVSVHHLRLNPVRSTFMRGTLTKKCLKKYHHTVNMWKDQDGNTWIFLYEDSTCATACVSGTSCRKPVHVVRKVHGTICPTTGTYHDREGFLSRQEHYRVSASSQDSPCGGGGPWEWSAARSTDPVSNHLQPWTWPALHHISTNCCTNCRSGCKFDNQLENWC